MRIKYCYLCNLPYEGPERWSPDRQFNIERLHCSQKCFRMWRIAYLSDNAFRLDHAIRRAREKLVDADENYGKELRTWIRTLESKLKSIRRVRRMNRRCRSLKAINRSSGDERS